MPVTASQNQSIYLPDSFYNKAGQLTVSAATAQQVAAAVQADAQALPPAEQAVFLQEVQTSTALAPGANGAPPADLTATLSRLENAAQSIQAFMSLAQNPSELAALLIEATFDAQKNAQQEATNTSQLQIADAVAQAAQDTAGAQTLQSSALTSLITSVIGSTVQLAAAVGSGLGALGGLSDISDLASDFDINLGGGGTGSSGGADASESEQAELFKADPDDIVDEGPPTTGAQNTSQDTDAAQTQDDEDESAPDAIKDAEDQVTKNNEFQLRLKQIGMKESLYTAVGQVGQALGQAAQAGASYATTMGQATNQNDQAQGQLDAAQGQYEQQLYNIAIGVVQSLQSFVEGEEQALNGIMQAQTGMGQAIQQAKAGF